MSKKEDLFELMERYNLTLRRLSDTETECYSFMHYRGLPNEEVFEVDGPSMTEEDVHKKAMRIFFETEMDWVREKYKKYTRKYRYGRKR